MTATTRARVLLIARDGQSATSIAESLADGYDLTRAACVDDAIQRACPTDSPDVVVFDVGAVTDERILQCKTLSRDAATRHASTLVLLDEQGAQAHAAMLGAGAVDCMTNPPSPPLLQARLRLLVELQLHRQGTGEENFRNLVRDSTQGIVIHRDMWMLFVNQAFAELHGYDSPEQVLALSRLDALIAPHDLGRLKRYAGTRLVRDGGAPVRYEYEALRADGAPLTLQCSASATRWEGSPAIQAAMVDVTEQRNAEVALRESEARFAAFFDNSPHTMSIQTPDGRIVQDNPAVRRFSNYDAAQAKGKLPKELWNSELVRKLEETNRRVLATLDVADCESEIWVGGERKYIHVTKFPIIDADGHLLALGSIGSEITERKAAEKRLTLYQQELRRLAAEVSLAAERERRRVSTEIHDGAVQNLGLARIKLGSLIKQLDGDGAADAGRLEELRELLIQSIRELRALMSELSPPMLYEIGLVPAVEWLAERFGERHALACRVIVTDEVPTLPSDVAVLLFQAVRELLNNVVKHARASQVTVELRTSDRQLEVCVADDGIGISPDRMAAGPTDAGGFGLFNMRERFKLVAGEMALEPGPGARIVVRVPLETATP